MFPDRRGKKKSVAMLVTFPKANGGQFRHGSAFRRHERLFVNAMRRLLIAQFLGVNNSTRHEAFKLICPGYRNFFGGITIMSTTSGPFLKRSPGRPGHWANHGNTTSGCLCLFALGDFRFLCGHRGYNLRGRGPKTRTMIILFVLTVDYSKVRRLGNGFSLAVMVGAP